MKDFEFYKIIRLSNNNSLLKIFKKLEVFYKTIPDTTGCMENISKEGGCNALCCKIQTPQFLYSEFLLVWDYISKNWTDSEICDLFEKCMLNAVDKIPSKGCVFFNEETCMCRIHEKRPMNCRIYGITPDEEFNPKYERLKQEYESIVGAVIMPQCNLISTCDGKKVSIKDTNRWWNKLVKIENLLGIPSDKINDKIGGSYRTPHDHVLLYNMPENVLNAIAGIKEYDDEIKKKTTIKEIIQVIENVFRNKS